MTIGPGVSWPRARPSRNSCGDSQCSWFTTCSWTNARMASPPPKVKAPTLKKNTPISHNPGVAELTPPPKAGQESPGTASHSPPQKRTPNRDAPATTAVTPQALEPYSATPTAPARIMPATIPRGVRPTATALQTAIIACLTSVTADLPSRYTATPKMPTTTGLTP